MKEVCQKLNLLLIGFIPDHYSAQQPWILEAGFWSDEADDLVSQYVGVLWYGAVLDDFIGSIAFETSHEKDAGLVPLKEKIEVAVTSIYGDDTTGGKGEIISSLNVSGLAIRDDSKIR